MPIVKPGQVPFSADEVHRWRQEMARQYEHQSVRRANRHVMVVRSPRDAPDPVGDLEEAFDRAAQLPTGELTDILLIGDRHDLHVPGHVADPLRRRRTALDERVAKAARAKLDVRFGAVAHHDASDLPDRFRLLVRIPRARCTELSDADVDEISAVVIPLVERLRKGEVRSVHLVADEDAQRYPPDEFMTDLRRRWPAVQARLAAEEAERAARKRRVEDVSGLVDVEVDAPALDPESAQAVDDAKRTLALRLNRQGFVIRPVADGDALEFEATRPEGEPRRIGVAVEPHLDRDGLARFERLAKSRGLGRLDLISVWITPEAVDARTVKVNVIRAGPLGAAHA